MKCGLETTRMLSYASYHGSPVDIAVIWHCASRTTIYRSVFMVIMLELRAWWVCIFHLTAMRYEYGRSLSPSNADAYVVLLQSNRFSRGRCPLHQWLVVRRRRTGTPRTASPVSSRIYSLQTASYMRSKYGLQLFFQSRIERNPSGDFDFYWFPVNHWVFEVFGYRILVPGIELPLTA